MLTIRSNLKIADTLIAASNGGIGGNAGQGGLPGKGGLGAPRKTINCAMQTVTWSSGAGGNGADGQRGGDGGPGAGGSTYGAYCSQSTLSVDEKTQLQAGPVADGGMGGTRGLVFDQWRCK